MPFRMMQVGLGDFGRRWMKIVSGHPSWEYAAIATRNGKVRDECGDEYGVPANRRFGTLSEAFSAGVEADAVLVTTPHFRHLEEVTVALDHGCSVLVEKPLAGDLESCLMLREKARHSSGVLMVGENYRFGDGARRMRGIVESGAVGTPEFVCIQYFVGHEFPKGDWRNDYEYPVLIENATHQFDLLRYVTGTDPVKVYCSAFGSARTPHWPKPNVSAHFEMDSGLMFDFAASWSYGEFRTPWEGIWRLYGSRGSIMWVENRIIIAAGGKRETIALPSMPSDHTRSATFDEFSNALEEGRRPTVDIEDNIRTVGMVFGAIRSSESGMPVSVQELIGD